MPSAVIAGEASGVEQTTPVAVDGNGTTTEGIRTNILDPQKEEQRAAEPALAIREPVLERSDASTTELSSEREPTTRDES